MSCTVAKSPRLYQERGIDAAITWALDHPTGSLLLYCPPGGGKTVLVAHLLRLLAAEQGMPAVAWAHRREIVFQIYDHLIECGVPREMIGILVSGDPGHEHDDPEQPPRRADFSAPIQVGTVGMIRRYHPPARVVWSDEAHMDAATGRRELRSLYPEAFHIGSTGSPCRLDGKGLNKEYDEILIVSSVSELLALGHLADPIVYTVPDELLPDLTRVRKRGGDYDMGELSRMANRLPIVGGIVEHWQRHAQGLRTIAFGVTRAHAQHITRCFNSAGIPWGDIDGTTPTDKRRGLLLQLAEGEILGLSCADLLTAGVDIPEVKCVIQARPTLSLVVHIQQTGRAMRPWEDATPIILDHAGNCLRHGLPQEDRPWEAIFRTSERAVAGKKWGEPRAKVCGACNAVMPLAAKKCRACGAAVIDSESTAIAPEREGFLVRARISEAAKAAAWVEILKVAKAANASKEWARKVFETRFGEAPKAA